MLIFSWIYLDVGSRDGFLAGTELIFESKKPNAENDYHEEMNGDVFEKWLE